MGAEGLGGYKGEEGDGLWVKPNGATQRRRVVRAQILGADKRGYCCFHFTTSLSLDLFLLSTSLDLAFGDWELKKQK